MLALIIFIVLALCGSHQLVGTTAVHVLNSIPYKYSAVSIIDQNEWKELQLDKLITQLDRTKTSFGTWGLTYLLYPIANQRELQERQKILSFLIEHDDILKYFQQQLSKIKKHEKSLIAYWDKKDQLYNNCEQFYYIIPGLKNYLNKNSLALNCSVAIQMLNASRNLLMSLCLGGVYEEMLAWTTNDKKKEFNLFEGIKKGLLQPIRQHNFQLELLKGREHDQYSIKDAVNIDINGTLGDRLYLYTHGYTFDATAFGLPVEYSSSVNKAANITQKGLAFLGASIHTLVYDYFWGSHLLSVLQQIIFMHISLKQLAERITGVIACFDAMQHLIYAMHVHTDIFDTYIYFDKSHDAMKFIKDLSKKKQSHTLLNHYGYALATHKEIKQIKSSFVPLLQTIALLDAYCSIAQLYKEHENKPNKFSFVTFSDSHKPYIAYKDAWLPLLPYDKAIKNDLYLGNDYAGKIIITGPNGCGKSVILIEYGIDAVLAQSWMIVPASHAEQTLFSSIKTGLAPHEDLQQGLSTFMAEKKCMEKLNSSIQKTHKDNNALILIDEPYKGTVDDESAKRIYNFGMNIARYPYALVCIATHVKKPISLAHDTYNIFANYHVEIVEESPGIFKRLFKLKPGPATWWFEDAEQRGRFVDWISVN